MSHIGLRWLIWTFALDLQIGSSAFQSSFTKVALGFVVVRVDEFEIIDRYDNRGKSEVLLFIGREIAGKSLAKQLFDAPHINFVIGQRL